LSVTQERLSIFFFRSIGVDFGIAQVVDGNWGIHAVIKKDIFAGGET